MTRQRLNHRQSSAPPGRWLGGVALGLALALAMGGASRGWASPNPALPSASPLPTTPLPPAAPVSPAGPMPPAEPIPLEGPAGQRLLLRASARADHGPLAQWFETQANLAYCGVASAVMALNSLAVPAPPVPGYGAYRFWTQTNAFAIPGSQGFVRPETVAREGMTLTQLHGWLAAAPELVVERIHGDRLSLAQWRALLRRSLQDPDDRLLVNYFRPALGQRGGGHISPLAAYDPASDKVLILDVARYRYPAAWVSAADLWTAMGAVDASAGRSRGLLLIRRR